MPKVTWPAAVTCQTADEPGAEPFLGARFAPARRDEILEVIRHADPATPPQPPL